MTKTHDASESQAKNDASSPDWAARGQDRKAKVGVSHEPVGEPVPPGGDEGAPVGTGTPLSHARQAPSSGNAGA